ncbi:PorT family protein [Nonlabens sp. Ci31]|uniref:outer membrane beta-barrel protein n=1 Tax=Nonlabens sp. Ci31 TaxID=2608253 RepID=UPI001464249F|nr:outer membrane beta-barrel protein [Nonlabens sp. Ci31]QJP34150.1 PorT family protein [Nonlabens sp. Ci31]
MRFISLLLLFLLGTLSSVAQDKKQTENAIPSVVDSLYREDQFYVGLSFNLITEQPRSFSQNGFSGGLHMGFIRDMPINKRRNLAIGVGLGVSTNTYNSNLFIGEEPSGETIFSIIDDSIDIDRNRFNTNLIEMPIQLRWRTSTPTNYSFWRIYAGVKFSYIYYYKAKYKSGGNSVIQTDIPELNRLRYAATLTLGHSSFNAFVQYDLITLFRKDALIDNQRVNLQPIKFGIEFYIL